MSSPGRTPNIFSPGQITHPKGIHKQLIAALDDPALRTWNETARSRQVCIDGWHINNKKHQRAFLDHCAEKHICIDHASVKKAKEVFLARKQKDPKITRNTLIFMNSYHMGLFLEQEHEWRGWDKEFGYR